MSFATPAFLVGCPRSGTTWLQLLLSRHPAVATCQETHLFGVYIRRLEIAWKREKERSVSGRRPIGLSGLLAEDEFYALCAEFSKTIFHKIAETKQGAWIVVEKTPNHLRHADLILRLFPNAYFLHIVRDPRSVVASLQHAGRTWGKQWAPADVASGARRWVRDVRSGREIAVATDRYLEVRYESLLEDGPSALGQILAFLGLTVEPDACRRAVEACRIDKLRDGSVARQQPWDLSVEPEGFFRRGNARSWVSELTRREVATVEYIAGDLMRELGYEPKVASTRRKPLSLVVHDTAGWLRERVRWRLAAMKGT